MSALTDAVANLGVRITQDFDRVKMLLEEALAANTADHEAAEALRAELAQIQEDQSRVVDQLNAIDLDPSFPQPQPDEPVMDVVDVVEPEHVHDPEA